MDDSPSIIVVIWLVADADRCPCNGVDATDVEITSMPSQETCSVMPLGGRGGKRGSS